MLKLGEFLFKFRDYTPIPFLILMIVFASTSPTSFWIGALSMILGESIRIIGVSYIGGVSRTKTYSTGKKLITGGPFSHVRNPLYIGNFFLSTGLVIMANVNVYFTLVFIAFFFFQYVPVVQWEESNLSNVFGQEFLDYKAAVPRWIPSVRSRLANQEKVKGDVKAALKSEKNTLTASFLTLVLILWRSGWFDSLFNSL